MFPMDVARALSAKLTLAFQFVHSKGYIHGGQLTFHGLVARFGTTAGLTLLLDIGLSNVLIGLDSSLDDLSIEQFREDYDIPETENMSRIDGLPLQPNCPAVSVMPMYLGKQAYEFVLGNAHRLVLADFGEAFAPARLDVSGRTAILRLLRWHPRLCSNPMHCFPMRLTFGA